MLTTELVKTLEVVSKVLCSKLTFTKTHICNMVIGGQAIACPAPRKKIEKLYTTIKVGLESASPMPTN